MAGTFAMGAAGAHRLSSTTVAGRRVAASPSIRAPGVHASTICRAAAPEAALSIPPSVDPAPSKYAIIDVGGTQHLVEEGRWYTCNRLQAEEGSKISFGRVLALKADGEFHVGRPYLESATVEGEVLEALLGPKVITYKMKPKKHTRKKVGHRQPLTKFMVTKIETSSS